MKPRWTGAAAVTALAFALLPMAATAVAAPLPAPAASTPSAGATVDQPLFSWAAVDGADHYEIEVALDDQFVTVTDPGDEMEARVVNGTTYVPTLTYTAKTHYWHVRAVASDGTKGTWSTPTEFTRRWTNDDEPTGTEQGQPGSRVENLRTLTGGHVLPINQVAFTWDPVPGASQYELEFSSDETFASESQVETTSCSTPHTTLTPYSSGKYTRSEVPTTTCPINPTRAQTIHSGTWTWDVRTRAVTITSSGADEVSDGDFIVVTYLDTNGVPLGSPITLSARAGDDGTIVISQLGKPAGDQGNVRWFKPEFALEPGVEYYVRVRATDGLSSDYPGDVPVVGLWSDHAQEPGEGNPDPLSFTVTDALEGDGLPDVPSTPRAQTLAGTDVPTLEWEPGAINPETSSVPTAYQVRIALDRDFTNTVARYETRSNQLIPNEVYDDLGPSKHYYWFAVPCSPTCVPDRLAINDPTYVGTFSKRSTPVTGLQATSRDSQTNALLRWGDALTAAQALDASFTPGGVEKYELQITDGGWSDAVSVMTDNLAYSTAAADPLASGTYHWRVRPYDGQGVPLAWATGTDFTIVQPDDPDPEPSPTQSTPNPGSSTPGGLPSTPPAPSGPPPDYQAPPPDEGTATDIAPEKPGKPGVKRSGKKYLRVHWRASEELGSPVSQYLVYRSTNGSSFSVVKRTTSTTVRVKSSKKKTYWFYVVADSDAGRSERSATTKFPK